MINPYVHIGTDVPVLSTQQEGFCGIQGGRYCKQLEDDAFIAKNLLYT